MNNYGRFEGKYPAIVKSYDKLTRTCLVEIPGITDGGDTLPDAEILYPVGDESGQAKANPTEIKIPVGALVWVEFIGGDQRRPLIVGFRNPRANNSVDWRRFQHKNIELKADTSIRLVVGSSVIEITVGGITINGTRIDLN
jgi:hypothetical protein